MQHAVQRDGAPQCRGDTKLAGISYAALSRAVDWRQDSTPIPLSLPYTGRLGTRLECAKPEAVNPAADRDPATDLLPADLAAHVRRRRPLHALRHQPAVPITKQTLSSVQRCDGYWGDHVAGLALHCGVPWDPSEDDAIGMPGTWRCSLGVQMMDTADDVPAWGSAGVRGSLRDGGCRCALR